LLFQVRWTALRWRLDTTRTGLDAAALPALHLFLEAGRRSARLTTRRRLDATTLAALHLLFGAQSAGSRRRLNPARTGRGTTWEGL